MQFSLHQGDCIEVMRSFHNNSFDSLVTDPPYGLSDHKPSDTVACLTAWVNGEEYRPKKKGFMGHAWDAWVPGPEVWREVFRVLKPGAHVAVFAGSRSHDLMSIALRMAGFECRDTIMWVYGSGFPKSLDVSKAIDKMAGAQREVIGKKVSTYDGANRDPDKHKTIQETSIDSHEWGYTGKSHAQMLTAPATDDAAQWEGWGTALKPAFEPILLFRKPLVGTVAENVLAYGVGALNIDGCRVAMNGEVVRTVQGQSAAQQDGSMYAGKDQRDKAEFESHDAGRWPANLIHDGSDEVVALFPHSNGQQGATGKRKQGAVYGTVTCGEEGIEPRGDTGSAARFFYCAKASKSDRNYGLDNHMYVTILLSIQQDGESWVKEEFQVRLLVDTGQSALRVIGVSGASNRSVTEWNTMLFGSEFMDLSQVDMTSTIRTRTNLTTRLTILNCFQRLLTNGNTQVASCEMARGGNLVESVEHSILSIITTSEKTGSVLGVERALSKTQWEISVKDAHSGHPTVKPIDLMRYVCRLITPPGGRILDNFCGSGSTLVGGILGGFEVVGIDLDQDSDGTPLGYLDIAYARARVAQIQAFDAEMESGEL